MENSLEILTTKQLLRLPPPKWLMEGIIYENTISGLYGQPGSGKSFIALDWAMCISEGMPWLGRFKTKQAPVVYIAAEGGQGIQKRVREWMRHYGVQSLPAMHWLLNPLYVREDGIVEEFLNTLERDHIGPEEYLNPGLMVVDTLSQSIGDGDENNSKDMGLFIGRVQKIAREKEMAALIVHHTNAEGKRERGHSSLRGNIDTMFKTEASENGDGRLILVTLTNNKQKDDAKVKPVYLAPAEGTTESLVLIETEAPEPRKKRGDGIPGPMRTVDMLRLLGSQDDGYTWGEWKAAAGIDKDRFNKRVRRLMKEGDIFKEGQRYYVTPANTDIAGMDDEDEDEGTGWR